MKKKFMLFSFLFLFVTALSSCNGIGGGNEGGGLDLGNIDVEGIEDEDVKYDDKTIKFKVPSNVDKFDVKKIKVAKGISLIAKNGKGEPIDDVLVLNPGVNTFTLSFKLGDQSLDWKLIIIREEAGTDPVVKEVKSIEVVNPKTTYKMNEKFKPSKLKVTYVDNTVEEITIKSSYLSGFTTATSGEKTVTVTYGGKSATYKITVTTEVAPVVTLTKVVVTSYEKDYVVNEEFKGAQAKAVYSDGSVVEFDITKNMLDGFDTSKPGNVTLTATYEDISVIFEITVHAKKVVVTYELRDVVKSYLNGEAFKGSVVKIVDGVETAYSITADMLTGFDNTKAGSQTVTITFETFTQNVTVTVAKAELTKEAVREAMANVTAFSMLKGYNEDVKKRFEQNLKEAEHYITDTDVDLVYGYLNLANVKNGQLKTLVELISNNLVTIYSWTAGLPLGGNPNQLITEIARVIDAKQIDYVKDTAVMALDVFTSEQMAQLFAIAMEEHSEYYSFTKYDEATKKMVHVTLDELLQEVSNPALEAFIKSSDKLRRIPTHMEQVTFIDSLKAVVFRICEIPTSEIISIRDALMDENFKLEKNIDKIHSIGGILNSIFSMNEFEALVNGYIQILGSEAVPLPHINDQNKLNTVYRYVASNLHVVAEFIETVDAETLKAADALLFNQSNPNGPDINSMKQLAKAAFALMTKLNKTEEDSKNLSLVLTILTQNEHAYQDISKALTLMMSVNVKPDGSLSDADMKKLDEAMMLINGLFSANNGQEVNYSYNNALVIKANTSVADFLKLFEESYSFYKNNYNPEPMPEPKPTYPGEYPGPTESIPGGKPIEKPKAVVDQTNLAQNLKTPGLHILHVTFEGVVLEIPYYVYDNASHRVEVVNQDYHSFNQTELIAYCDKDGKVIKFNFMAEYGPVEDKEINAEEFLNNQRLIAYIPELHAMFKISQKDVKSMRVISESQAGIKVGVIEIQTTFGNAYLLVHYTTIDTQNQKLTSYSTNEHSENHFIIQNQDRVTVYLSYNNGFTTETITLYNGKEIDTTKSGKITYNHNGLALEFTVVSNEEAKKPTKILGFEMICNEALDECLKIEKNGINYITGSGERRWTQVYNFTKEAYNASHKLSIKVLRELGNGEFEYELKVTAENGTVVDTFKFTQTPISKEEFNKEDYKVERNGASSKLTDEELMMLQKGSEAQRLEFARKHLSECRLFVFSIKNPGGASYEDVLGYFDSHNIKYELVVDFKDDKTLMILLIVDGRTIYDVYMTTSNGSFGDFEKFYLKYFGKPVPYTEKLDRNTAMKIIAETHHLVLSNKYDETIIDDPAQIYEFLNDPSITFDLLDSYEQGFDFVVRSNMCKFNGHVDFENNDKPQPNEEYIQYVAYHAEPKEKFISFEILGSHIDYIELSFADGRPNKQLVNLEEFARYIDGYNVSEDEKCFYINIPRYPGQIVIAKETGNPNPDPKPMVDVYLKYINVKPQTRPVMENELIDMINNGDVQLMALLNGQEVNLGNDPDLLNTIKVVHHEVNPGAYVMYYEIHFKEINGRFIGEFPMEVAPMPEPGQLMNIEQVLNQNANIDIKFKGKVVAVFQYESIVMDNTGAILVRNDQFKYKVGDVVEISGQLKDKYNQCSVYVTTATLLQEDINLDNFVEEANSDVFYDFRQQVRPRIRYVKVRGQIVQNGKYTNLKVSGGNYVETASFYGITPDDTNNAKLLVGKYVEFVGYLTKVSMGKYVNIYFESFTEYKPHKDQVFQDMQKQLDTVIPHSAITSTQSFTINPGLTQLVLVNTIPGVTYSNNVLTFDPNQTISGELLFACTYEGDTIEVKYHVDLVASNADINLTIADFATLDPAVQTNFTSVPSFTLNGVTFSFTFPKGGTASKLHESKEIRFYKGNTMTITCEKQISRIEFITGKYDNITPSLAVDSGSIDLPTQSWNGNATTVTFTAGAKVFFTGIRIYFA